MSERLRALTPDELKRLTEWFSREMGLDISIYRPEFIARRFLPRASAMGFRDLRQYIDHAGSNEAERRMARKRLLVPTTEFFRNRDVFKAFFNCLKRSRAEEDWKSITILSAPCSTGEEAWSLALFCDELSVDARVVALDRSMPSLRQAAGARYNKKALSKLDKIEIKRYFKGEGSHRTLEDRVLRKVFPLCCDLGSGIPLKAVHAVFMRNFFIYLTDGAQNNVIENVKKVLVDGGLLVLGKVERLRMNAGEWRSVDLESKIYMFKRGRQ